MCSVRGSRDGKTNNLACNLAYSGSSSGELLSHSIFVGSQSSISSLALEKSQKVQVLGLALLAALVVWKFAEF